MRRLIIEEPVSRAATWSPRVAAFALAVTIIAVLFTRSGTIDLNAGAVAIGTGLGLAALAVLLAFVAYLRIWTEGRRGLGSAVGGMFLGLAILAYPAWFAVKGFTLPALNDISTDIESPPAFSRSQAAMTARHGRVPPEVPAAERRRQRIAYPYIAPLTLDMPPGEAFELVRRAVERRGWDIVEAVKPGGRIGAGHIDAVARTFLLRIPDDVTIRIRPVADGSRIDVRSASRIGDRDFGANADRIRRFYDELSNLALGVK